MLATGFGSGYFPKIPGTAGTFFAIPIVLLFGLSGELGYVAITFAFIIFSIFVCQGYERFYAGHDRSEVVIDEIAGFLVTMVLLPLTWKSLTLGFLLFRFFDILKPFPIGYLDRKVKGGFGVVVDDLAAGLVANFILQQLVSYL